MFGKYQAESPKPLPSFSAFLKDKKDSKVLTQNFGVEIIWVPGKYPNYTLQTHAFRLSISDKHPLYQALNDFMLDVGDDHQTKRIDIVITDAESKEFELRENAKKKVNWKWLGKTGYKATEL